MEACSRAIWLRMGLGSIHQHALPGHGMKVGYRVSHVVEPLAESAPHTGAPSPPLAPALPVPPFLLVVPRWAWT